MPADILVMRLLLVKLGFYIIALFVKPLSLEDRPAE